MPSAYSHTASSVLRFRADQKSLASRPPKIRAACWRRNRLWWEEPPSEVSSFLWNEVLDLRIGSTDRSSPSFQQRLHHSRGPGASSLDAIGMTPRIRFILQRHLSSRRATKLPYWARPFFEAARGRRRPRDGCRRVGGSTRVHPRCADFYCRIVAIRRSRSIANDVRRRENSSTGCEIG